MQRTDEELREAYRQRGLPEEQIAEIERLRHLGTRVQVEKAIFNERHARALAEQDWNNPVLAEKLSRA